MTEEKVWELLAELVASQKKTDEQLAKTDAKLDRIAEMLGGVSNNQGKVAEEFFYNTLREHPVLLGKTFDTIDKNITRSVQKIQEEYDILLYNGDSVFIIEVKYRVHPRSSTMSTFVIDTTKPTFSVNPVIKNQLDNSTDNTSSAEVYVEFAVSDTNASAGMEYYITESATKVPTASDFDNTTGSNYVAGHVDNVTDNQTVTYRFSTPEKDNGTDYIYVWLLDAAGNISDNKSDSIQIVDNDTTRPTVSYFAIYGVSPDNGSTLWDNGSYTNSQSYQFKATFADTGFGVTGYIVSENATYNPEDNSSFTWSAIDNLTGTSQSGSFIGTGTFDNNSIDNKTVYLWLKDGSGNVISTAGNDTIVFDNEGPVFSSAITIHTDNVTQVGSDNYTNSQTVVLNNISATDNGSAVFGLYLSETSTAPTVTDNSTGIWRSLDNRTYTFSSATNESKTIYAWLLDNASNISSSSSVSVVYDNTSPVVNGSRLALDNLSDNTSHYIFNFATTTANVSDALSPIYAYLVTDNVTLAYTNDNITASAADWKEFATPDLSFDNTSENMSYAYPEAVTSGDNFTIYVWFKDAAQNILTDNFTLQAGKYFTK